VHKLTLKINFEQEKLILIVIYNKLKFDLLNYYIYNLYNQLNHYISLIILNVNISLIKIKKII